MKRIILAALACLLVLTQAAGAAEITIRKGRLVLDANLEMAEGKTFSDGVLLMTHGTLAHNRMETIAALQRLLRARGVSSLAINLSLGVSNRHNMYDCNQPMRHRHEDALEEIDAWVNWLKSRGASVIWLFGHSRGGAQTAWYAAARAPREVRKVVLLAPMTYDAKKAAAAYKARFGAPLAPMLAQARDFVRAGHGGEPMELPGILYCKDARATPESFLSYHAPDPRRDTPRWLKSVKVPTLVIAGTEDKVIGDLIARVEPLSDGARLRLKIIDDADHFFRDFAAEDAADAIAEFLAR